MSKSGLKAWLKAHALAITFGFFSAITASVGYAYKAGLILNTTTADERYLLKKDALTEDRAKGMFVSKDVNDAQFKAIMGGLDRINKKQDELDAAFRNAYFNRK